jgi:hypothetical protein
MSRCRRFGSDGAGEATREISADQRPRFDVAVSHRKTPSRWRQRHGGESEAGACAKHVVGIARLATDLVFSCGSVKCACRAAATVVVHRTVALGRGAERARNANDRPLGTVLSNLARLATEGVRRIVARSTDRALGAALLRLVRARRAFNTPGPVGTTWSIGSL